MPSISVSEIRRRSRNLLSLIDPCRLCPRHCGANRLHGKIGLCGGGDKVRLSAFMAHQGEEPPLIHDSGSGTVFLTGCTGSCIFCQNYQISIYKDGNWISEMEMAQIFLSLQQQKCSNINWVTPEPHLPFLLNSLALALEQGLNLPLVFNSNGYIEPEILKYLEGIVDIYLPDMKYGNDLWAEELSGFKNYTSINQAAVTEMYRQTGSLQINEQGVAEKGLLIRHLILPEGLAGTTQVFEFISNLDPDIPISLMAQYQPRFNACKHPIINRGITGIEYDNALEAAGLFGLSNIYCQTPSSINDGFFPDFEQPSDKIFNN